jgi:hypothetical protein
LAIDTSSHPQQAGSKHIENLFGWRHNISTLGVGVLADPLGER